MKNISTCDHCDLAELKSLSAVLLNSLAVGSLHEEPSRIHIASVSKLKSNLLDRLGLVADIESQDVDTIHVKIAAFKDIVASEKSAWGKVYSTT